MKRVVLCLIAGMMLTGCGGSGVAVAEPVSSPGGTTLSIPEVKPVTVTEKRPATVSLADLKMPTEFYTSTSRALGPDTVFIDITNYELGATKEWPILVHNGDGLKAKQLIIETEADETVAAIPINIVLANNGLLDIISIESTLREERLEAVAYDSSTRLLTIKGFTPLSKRIVKITYKTLSDYTISFSLRSEGEKGYSLAGEQIEQWFSVDTPKLALRPFETKTVTAKLTIPPESRVTARKVVFWIAAIETVSTKGQVETEIGNKQRVFVNFN